MQNPLSPIFIAHATAGGLMLLSGAVALAARKANNWHRLAGKVYVYSTSLVGITGLVIAIQKSNQFLIGTSVFVLYMLATSYRSLYLKQLHKTKKAEALDWVIGGFGALATIFLLLYGGVSLFNGNKGGIVPIVFGVLCFGFVRRDVQKFTKADLDKKHWLYNHLTGMVGSYIAGFTAFLAVNAPMFVEGFSLVVWLGPTLIGVPLIIYYRRKYQRKTSDLKQELGLKINANER